MTGRDRLGADVLFAIVPEWVLYASVSDKAIRLYAVLHRHADKTRGVAWPSRRTLAKELKVKDPKTVDRAARELVDLGALTIERRFDDAGDPTSNLYRIRAVPPGGRGADATTPGTERHHGGGAGATTGGGADATQTRVSRNESQKNESPPTLSDARDRVSGAEERERLKAALLEACDLDEGEMTRSARRELDDAVDELADVKASPDQVEERALEFSMRWPDATLTPRGLVKQWARLKPAPQAQAGSSSTSAPANRPAWCETCGQLEAECWCSNTDRRIAFGQAVSS